MEEEVKPKSDSNDNVDSNIDEFVKFNEFIDVIREMNDEVLQVEELRIHTEELKGDLIRYFTDIMEKYDFELMIPAESFHPEEKGNNNLQAVFLNDSGIISYNFKDGSLKSYKLSDYQPDELMSIFLVVMPHLKEVLTAKRKEYEKISNRLSKIRKYLTFFKEKYTEAPKHTALSPDRLNKEVDGQ